MVEKTLIVDSYIVDSSTRKPSTSKPATKKPLMAVLLLLFFMAAAIAMAPTASAWDYSRNITINASQIPSEQTNFPVLLNLSGTWLKTAPTGHINTADASDVVFTTDGEASGYNQIKLDWEREEYDGTNGELVAWVRIPTLKSGGEREGGELMVKGLMVKGDG